MLVEELSGEFHRPPLIAATLPSRSGYLAREIRAIRNKFDGWLITRLNIWSLKPTNGLLAIVERLDGHVEHTV
jgi:hypothetical protein